jgi:hypothetical protein
MRARLAVPLLGPFIGAAWLLSQGCGTDRPIAPTTGQELSSVKLEGIFAHSNGITAYTLVGDPKHLLLRYATFGIKSEPAATAKRYTFGDLVAMNLGEDIVLNQSFAWRIIPSRGFAPKQIGRGGDLTDTSEVPPDPGGTEGGNPPPAPPPPPCALCCNACCVGGDITWGCLKCCYQ